MPHVSEHRPALLTITRDLFIILLTRLMKQKTERWTQGFIRALFLAFALNRPNFGPNEIVAQFESIQPG